MASILQTIIGFSQFRIREEAADVQIWTNLKVGNVEIGTDAETARSPVMTRDLTEQNVYINLQELDIQNSKILRPSKMRVTFLTDNMSDVEAVERSFFDTTQTYEIYTRNIIATQMVLLTVSIEQPQAMTNAVRLICEFEQGLRPTPLVFAPDSFADFSVFGVSVNSLAEVAGNAASDLADKVLGYFA